MSIMNPNIAAEGIRPYVSIIVMIMIFCSCIHNPENSIQPGTYILIDTIPPTMDILFSSIRYVLEDAACMTWKDQVKENFLHDPDCSRKIYDPERGLASPRQLFALDIETGTVLQITSSPWWVVSGQAIDPTTIVTSAACSDSNGDGIINDRDQIDIYLLNLITADMQCLTCASGLEAINNCDYSPIHEKIIFSARQGSAATPHFLFTVDHYGTVIQITHDSQYMDFDCSWSEDGTKIVFSRLPSPWFESPSQIWIMNSDGTNLQQLTAGGGNPHDEGSHGVYPIGIDADPDLNPENSKIVFSRLKTGKQNQPFGIYELIIMDLATGEEQMLDSSYANMVPEWKSRGILFIRQVGADSPMNRIQCLYLYAQGEWVALETPPYIIFPLGAYSGSWIPFAEQQ